MRTLRISTVLAALFGLFILAPNTCFAADDSCIENPSYCTRANRNVTTKVAPVYTGSVPAPYCQRVTPTIAPMMVPTRTREEFDSFLNWAPQHTSITSVAGCSCGDGTLDATGYGALDGGGTYIGCSGGYFTDPVTRIQYECPENCDFGAQNGGVSPYNSPANCNPASVPYGQTCQFCATTCKLTTIGGGACGDATIQGAEQCDGTNLGGNTCATLGYYTGSLSCTGSCTFNTGACHNCGNGVCQAGETWAACSGDCPQCSFGSTGCCAGTCCAGYTPSGSGTCNPIACYSACGRLHTDQYLRASINESLSSCSGNVHLTVQNDGNVVLYEGGTAIWASNTVGMGGAGNILIMQSDGNLVLYDNINLPRNALWASNYVGDGGTLVVQDDGNLVVVSNTNCSSVLWAANSCIAARRDACGTCFGPVASCSAPNICYQNTCIPPPPTCQPDALPVYCNFPPGQIFGDSLIHTDTCGAQTVETCPTFFGRTWCANDYIASPSGAPACLNLVECTINIVAGRLMNLHVTNTLGHHAWCWCSTCDQATNNITGCGSCYFQ